MIIISVNIDINIFKIWGLIRQLSKGNLRILRKSEVKWTWGNVRESEGKNKEKREI